MFLSLDGFPSHHWPFVHLISGHLTLFTDKIILGDDRFPGISDFWDRERVPPGSTGHSNRLHHGSVSKDPIPGCPKMSKDDPSN